MSHYLVTDGTLDEMARAWWRAGCERMIADGLASCLPLWLQPVALRASIGVWMRQLATGTGAPQTQADFRALAVLDEIRGDS